jgi:hypothetical protein
MPQITIGGDVNMIGWEGKRISVWENIHSNGKDYSRLWTCWFDTPQIQLQEQDFVEISGELSTKIGKYTPKGQTEEKLVVEHHIQEAFIKSQVSKKQQTENLAQFEEMPF